MSERDIIGLAVVSSGSQGNELLYRNPKYKHHVSGRGVSENTDDDLLAHSSSIASATKEMASFTEFKDFSSFDNQLLQHICVLNHSRIGRPFHLEIDRVAFIGYPVSWGVKRLHLVFATKANISTQLVEQLCSLSHKAALMLLQEAEILNDLSFDDEDAVGSREVSVCKYIGLQKKRN